MRAFKIVGWQWRPGIGSMLYWGNPNDWRDALTRREAELKAYDHNGEFRPIYAKDRVHKARKPLPFNIYYSG